MVLGWEMVALETEGADPNLGGEINVAVRVENYDTGLAAERVVW